MPAPVLASSFLEVARPAPVTKNAPSAEAAEAAGGASFREHLERKKPAAKPKPEVAERAETLPYEILCSMGKRVVRMFLREGQPPKILTLIGERQESEAAGAGTRRARKVQYKSTRIPG